MKLRSVPWDRLLTAAPLDATAATVASRSGAYYDPAINYGSQRHWDAPPVGVPFAEKIGNNPEFVDLTGRKFGEFTVVKYLGSKNHGERATWLCRCSCGDYENRKTRAVKNASNTEDRCRKCRDWLEKRRRYDKIGAKPLTAFTGKQS